MITAHDRYSFDISNIAVPVKQFVLYPYAPLGRPLAEILQEQRLLPASVQDECQDVFGA